MPNGTLTKYPDYYCSNPEQGFRIEAKRKLRKGLHKADKEPTSEAIIALGRSLLDADVPFLEVSSYRISQYLRGQFARRITRLRRPQAGHAKGRLSNPRRYHPTPLRSYKDSTRLEERTQMNNIPKEIRERLKRLCPYVGPNIPNSVREKAREFWPAPYRSDEDVGWQWNCATWIPITCRCFREVHAVYRKC